MQSPLLHFTVQASTKERADLDVVCVAFCIPGAVRSALTSTSWHTATAFFRRVARHASFQKQYLSCSAGVSFISICECQNNIIVAYIEEAD